MPEIRDRGDAEDGQWRDRFYSSRDRTPWSWRRYIELTLSPYINSWAVAKVGGVDLRNDFTRLADGLSICRRSASVVHKRYPWWNADLDDAMLQIDMSEGIVWTLLVHERTLLKEPDNRVLVSNPAEHFPMYWLRVALQLVSDGPVWMGSTLHGRADSLAPGGRTIPAGPTFRWPTAPAPIDLSKTMKVYRALRAAEPRFGGDLAHIERALGRYSQTFDRGPSYADALIDDITALEGAVGGHGSELRFSWHSGSRECSNGTRRHAWGCFVTCRASTTFAVGWCTATDSALPSQRC
jgi:hypothetical protein